MTTNQRQGEHQQRDSVKLARGTPPQAQLSQELLSQELRSQKALLRNLTGAIATSSVMSKSEGISPLTSIGSTLGRGLLRWLTTVARTKGMFPDGAATTSMVFSAFAAETARATIASDCACRAGDSTGGSTGSFPGSNASVWATFLPETSFDESAAGAAF